MVSIKTEAKKSNKNLIILGVVGIVVVIAATVGYFINSGLQVKASLNDNAKIINDNGSYIKKKFNDFANNTRNIPLENTAQIDAYSKQTTADAQKIIDDTKNETTKSKATLKSGFNDDTNEYYEQSKKVLENRLLLIDQTSATITDLNCITTKFVSIATNFEGVSAKLATISSDTSASAKSLDESVALVNVAVESNKGLNECLDKSLKEFYTPTIKAAIQSDTNFYTSFASALSMLSEGVKTNSLSKINQANTLITSVASKQPVLFTNAEFNDLLTNKAVNKITNATKEVEAQTDTLNELSNKISKKYLIL